ncbi:MAG: L-fucose:H+ symporter permease [Planctomycetes bacterium]|nr:L-fucose:H+ symporter permease [Planctomycetota bacterium]
MAEPQETHDGLEADGHGLIPKGIVWPFALLTSLFAWWAVANNMTDTLLPAFKRILSLSDSTTAVIQLVCYLFGYGCLAIPGAIFIRRYSYKAGVLLGLGLYVIGTFLFYPAGLTGSFPFFLAAIWILFSGLSILETAANPYIIAMGSEESATRRLNFAQAFNPFGAVMGVVLSNLFILSKLSKATAEERAQMAPAELKAIQQGEIGAITVTYVTIGAILAVTWILIAINRRFPRTGDKSGPMDLGPTFRRLLHNRNYLLGTLAQFFYVGAQIGIWSFIIRYVMQELDLEAVAQSGEGRTAEAMGSDYYIASLILFLVFRFLCTALMKYISPANLLSALSAIAAVLLLATVCLGGPVGVYSLVFVSACMSLMFPTIFGLSVRGLGEDTKIASSGQIMAIAGAAAVTQLEGLVSDSFGIRYAFWVPFVCFVYIAYYALVECRRKLPSAPAQA